MRTPEINIDPQNITNFNRTEEELEAFLIFCIFVANKNSSVIAQKINTMFNDIGIGPFAYINFKLKEGKLRSWLEKHKIGQYTRFTLTLTQIAETFVQGDRLLSSCSLADLQDIKGVGLKTSRFFCLHSRANTTCAVLDTHVLKWLNEMYNTIHKSTPTNYADYKLLEGLFLGECHKWQKSAAQMDTFIWQYYSNEKS